MPNTSSAKKAMRVAQRRNTINTRTKFKFKEAIKALQQKVNEGDVVGAQELLKKAMATLDKAAKKNVIPKKRASRKKSRLTKAVNKLSVK